MMRRTILLAVLLTMPGLVMAQPLQTESKPFSKVKPSTAPTREGSKSALEKPSKAEAAKPDGFAPPDVSDSAEADGPKQPLAAKMFLTHNPGGFTKVWKAGADSLPTTKTISQTMPVMVMVAVSGCKRGKDGKCAVTFTSRTAGPDGLFDKPEISPPWKPEPMGSQPELAPASFGLRLGPGDPPGRYTIEVRVTDTVAKSSRTLTAMVMKPAAAGGR